MSTGELDTQLASVLSESVVTRLSKWQAEQGLTLHFERWLTDGHTRAPVAVVGVLGGTAARKLILKACPPDRLTSAEPRLHARALESSPAAFRHAHLVDQAFPPAETSDKWRVLFLEIAGASLEQVRPLSTLLTDARLPEVLGAIAGTMQQEWNPVAFTRRVSLPEAVTAHLGSKLDRNGPLTGFARDFDLDSDWVRFGDAPARVVPNAIAWVLNPLRWPTEGFFAQFGNTHGDLHPGNILVRVDPTPESEEFRLIDLASFNPDGPLTKDLTHLLLSVAHRNLTETPAVRRELLEIVLGIIPLTPSIELLGVREVASRLQAVLDDSPYVGDGMADDWHLQRRIAIACEALEFVGRRSLPDSHRLWFFEVACNALAVLLPRLGVEAPADPAGVPVVGSARPAEIVAVSEAVFEACDRFSAARTLIAVLAPSLEPGEDRWIGRLPWNCIVTWDSKVDSEGALASVRSFTSRVHRLVTLDQECEIRSGSTTWLALGGLSDRSESATNVSYRDWRRTFWSTIDRCADTIARFSPKPLTVVIFGEPDERVRTVFESIDDRLGERLRTCIVAPGAVNAEDYGAEHLVAPAGAVLEAIPFDDGAPTAAGTVPGQEGPVLLADEDVAWIREMVDLLDSTAGTAGTGLEDVGTGFLRGREASWYELGLSIDVVPPIEHEVVARLQEDLSSRQTVRSNILHFPGAGGTTLARRVGWDLHGAFPVVWTQSAHDAYGLAQRVTHLSQATGLSVLVILEQTTDIEVDRLFNRLRSDSVPAVLLWVTRRLHRPHEAALRSYYLGPAQTPNEVHTLATRYASYAPERAELLYSVAPGAPEAVPFYFGLITFEEGYEGLPTHVSASLSTASDQELLIVSLIALCHRYAGTSVAADLFADVLFIPADGDVNLERRLSEAARSLLVEDEPGYWRTTHWLVASEILRQILGAPQSDPNGWVLGLSAHAHRFLSEARTVFGDQPPDDIAEVLSRLFIVRENRALLGEERRGAFSELLEAVPSANGRLELLRKLAESYPNEPHYWAHLGRLLSYELGATEEALDALNRALVLSENDALLFHMRGMVYRRSQRELGRSSSVFDEAELIRLTELALSDFATAASLDDSSEYPHVTAVQTAVGAIETAKRASDAKNFAEFLTRPGSAVYRALLEQAEVAMDAVREIKAGDRLSAAAEAARIEMSALYDDYSTLLQGWRNLLDRDDVLKTPIRRRLVRGYLQRAGDWSALRSQDLARVVALLEENLRDDPTDDISLRNWLRAARRNGTSLDRAAEFVEYWAAQSNSRDALYYDYVISALEVLDGRESVWREARRKIERCRERSASFGNRKFSYEWLGRGSGLESLVNDADVPREWDRNRGGDIPTILVRHPARILKITSPQAGTLRLEAGNLDAFFVPAVAGAARGRHENARVEAVIGFSYDGLRAWSVRLVHSASESS